MDRLFGYCRSIECTLPTLMLLVIKVHLFYVNSMNWLLVYGYLRYKKNNGLISKITKLNKILYANKHSFYDNIKMYHSSKHKYWYYLYSSIILNSNNGSTMRWHCCFIVLNFHNVEMSNHTSGTLFYTPLSMRNNTSYICLKYALTISSNYFLVIFLIVNCKIQ